MGAVSTSQPGINTYALTVCSRIFKRVRDLGYRKDLAFIRMHMKLWYSVPSARKSELLTDDGT